MSKIDSLSKQLIVLLAATSALGPAGMQILLPALPVIQDDFSVSNDVAQLTLSLSMFSIAIGTLVYGPMSDKYGRKPTMLLGIFIAIIGSIFCYLADSIGWLIAGRIIQAFGGAVGLVLARAIVRDVYGAEESARVIATLVMVMVIAPMMSPALGGEMMNRFGWESVFLVMAGASVIIFVFLILRQPETLVTPVQFEGIGSMLRTFDGLLRSRPFCGYAFCVTFVSVVFFSFISAAPEIMVSVLNRPPTEYGYYFVMIPIGFMIGNYVTRHFGRSISIDSMIVLGSTIAIGGIVLAIVLNLVGLSHPLALFLPVSIAVFGNGITLPNAQAAAINEFPQYAGSASGLTGFLQMSVSAVAAQFVAFIFNETAYPLLIMMLLASVISLFLFRWGVPVSTAAS
ncbi:MAG: multidrug effflux MFS transporter [Pseudomonadota bacterium]|nr:multidrug effflux MFS transporter [Pseudomonadota bacterium]